MLIASSFRLSVIDCFILFMKQAEGSACMNILNKNIALKCDIGPLYIKAHHKIMP